MTSASMIADAVQDIREGRVYSPGAKWPVDRYRYPALQVIDATEIYRSIVAADKPIALYEDHESIVPPWGNFAVCYVNSNNSVICCMCVTGAVVDWETENIADWSIVKHRITTLVFCSGKASTAGPNTFGTIGPLYGLQYAIAENGNPLDLHWTELAGGGINHAEMAQAVLLKSLDFLNCRNVEIVEPSRPRAERRRIERTGQRIHTINVFPAGKTSRSRGEPVNPGVPLTSVRGHFAHYGPKYDRALLFGKIEGRFWIPQFARGSKEFGEIEHDYKLRSEP